MPAISTYTLSENAYVKALLGDYKWATNSLTFSFPTKSTDYSATYGNGENLEGFGAMSSTQQNAVRSALDIFSSVADLTFTETSGSSAKSADLRYALSDVPNTAWAYYPSTSSEGGDAWFNNSRGYYDSPAKGNYANMTILHETGHALGLEHPHEGYKMPANGDSMEYSVMSYKSYVGASATSGYTNERWGYAQSLMMYDIAALQHMYGANYTQNSGDTIYSWSPTTGEMFVNGAGKGAPGANKIFLTVWDGGGTDTYDFTNYTTNLKIDLGPGKWTVTSSEQLAKLSYDGSKIAVGNIANALQYKGDTRSLIENAKGGTGNDVIAGNAAENSLYGNGGSDLLFGSTGNDRLYGGTGDDNLSGDGGADKIVDSFGTNFLTGGTGNDIISAFSGDSALYGGLNDDILTGGIGADNLYGEAGHDVLIGDISTTFFGNDVLLGGKGNDLMSGGGGADQFVFNPADGTDTIGRLSVNFATPSNSALIGPDFQSGLDTVVLAGFGYVTPEEAFSKVMDQSGTATFSDQGSTISFYGLSVSDLSADDFSVVPSAGDTVLV